MQKLLSERKNKLRVTEQVIEKKGAVVDKVQKILHSKERKVNYTERKRLETAMFGARPKRRTRSGGNCEEEEDEGDCEGGKIEGEDNGDKNGSEEIVEVAVDKETVGADDDDSNRGGIVTETQRPEDDKQEKDC